jgi:hypothetical protein
MIRPIRRNNMSIEILDATPVLPAAYVEKDSNQ